MVNDLKFIVANLFHIIILLKFVRIFFDDIKVRKHTKLIVYGLFYIISTALHLKFHFPLLNFLSLILGILSFTILYTRDCRKILFVAASVFLVDLTCNIVVELEFVNYIAAKTFDENYEVLIVFLLFLCELLGEKIIKKRNSVYDVHKVPVILIPIISLIILGLLLSDMFSLKEKEIIVSTGLLILCFLFFYLYDMLIGAFGNKYENDILKEKVNIYANQIEIALESENRVKRLRHDMKHHMNEIKILAINKDTVGIQGYIDQMEEFLHNSDEIVSSGNIKIDSLLNYMLQKAQNKLKNVKVKVQLPEKMKHTFDINIIVGNLLENAIEAAEKTKEKELHVLIQFKKDVLRVEISNSCLENQIKGKQGFLTTKKETGLHGIGLSNVRKIVEKYDGVIDASKKGTVFTVKSILYLSKTESE